MRRLLCFLPGALINSEHRLLGVLRNCKNAAACAHRRVCRSCSHVNRIYCNYVARTLTSIDATATGERPIKR